MIVVAGCLIVRDNKILMVQEAKKQCYGKWNYPAGHVDNFEAIPEAAIREVFEETGCKVKLTGVLPVYYKVTRAEEKTSIHVRFTAEIVEENINFDKSEILDAKWIDIEDLKSMPEEEIRASAINLQLLDDFEKGKIYPLEIFDNKKFEE